MVITTKGRYHVRLSLLFGCGQVRFSSDNIAGFFDQQYLWKKRIIVFDILLKDCHQVKKASESIFLVGYPTKKACRTCSAMSKHLQIYQC